MAKKYKKPVGVKCKKCKWWLGVAGMTGYEMPTLKHEYRWCKRLPDSVRKNGDDFCGEFEKIE